MRNALDDYLLELILMDSLVFASSRRIPDADLIIRSFIPSGSYDQIMEHYDGLSAEWADEETDLCRVLAEMRSQEEFRVETDDDRALVRDRLSRRMR